jgi:DNA-binding MarR family transcriptional regulator
VRNTQNKPGVFLLPSVINQLVGSLMVDVVDGTSFQDNEFGVASSIWSWPDATPTELARWLGMRPTTLSATLKRLEERGLVARTRDPDDGRRYVLRTTAKGDRELEKAFVRFRYWRKRVWDELGGDPDVVLEPMRRLEEALRAVLEHENGA